MVNTRTNVATMWTVPLAKLEELCKDADVMSHTFERVVDRKDAILHSLAKDLEEAEEQYPSLKRRIIWHVCKE